MNPRRRQRLRACLTAAIVIAGGTVHAKADDVLAAVAANFAGAAEALGKQFAESSGHTLVVTTGSTGKLYAQIGEGAPFDILLSADVKTPEKLVTEKHAVAGSQFTYAIGKVTLWSADAKAVGPDPVASLLAPETIFVAIANPELAPYGVAAREALTAMGAWDEVQAKIVMGQNIGQTFSLVDTGAAQMGFVATSALQGPGIEPRGSRYEVSATMHAPLKQDAVLLEHGNDNAAAAAFLEFLKSPEAHATIESFGYGLDRQ